MQNGLKTRALRKRSGGPGNIADELPRVEADVPVYQASGTSTLFSSSSFSVSSPRSILSTAPTRTAFPTRTMRDGDYTAEANVDILEHLKGETIAIL